MEFKLVSFSSKVSFLGVRCIVCCLHINTVLQCSVVHMVLAHVFLKLPFAIDNLNRGVGLVHK